MEQSKTSSATAPTTSSGDVSTPARSLPVALEQFKDQCLLCPVCRDTFQLKERAPKLLSCNHAVCLPCLTQVFEHAPRVFDHTPRLFDHTLLAFDYDQSNHVHKRVKCPTCRREVILNNEGLKSLPNNHLIVQMLEFLSQVPATTPNTSSTQEDQQSMVNETVPNQAEAGPGSQKINDIFDALSYLPTFCDNMEQEKKDTLERMKIRSEALANASENLTYLGPRLMSAIKDKFSEYHDMLRQREEFLCKMVSQFIDDKKKEIHLRYNRVMEDRLYLQELQDELRQTRHGSDLSKLLTTIQVIRESETIFVQTAHEDDTDLFQTCEFVAQNEATFYEGITELGEIQARYDHQLQERGHLVLQGPECHGEGRCPGGEHTSDSWPGTKCGYDESLPQIMDYFSTDSKHKVNSSDVSNTTKDEVSASTNQGQPRPCKRFIQMMMRTGKNK